MSQDHAKDHAKQVSSRVIDLAKLTVIETDSAVPSGFTIIPTDDEVSPGPTAGPSLSDALTKIPNIPEASNTMPGMPEASTPTSPTESEHSPISRRGSCDAVLPGSAQQHGSDEFSHNLKRVGPSPILRIDEKKGRGTWVCSGEVVTNDGPEIWRWMSSEALHALGSKLGTLLNGRHLVDLAGNEDKVSGNERIVIRSEDLTASCFQRTMPDSHKERVIRTRIHEAALDLQDDFRSNLPKTSFEAIPEDPDVTV